MALPNPPHFELQLPRLMTLISVTATDKYTVVFKWKTPNPEVIMETLWRRLAPRTCIESPEAVKLWGNLNDWHHAIGTGPFILTGFCFRQFGDPGQESQLLGI